MSEVDPSQPDRNSYASTKRGAVRADRDAAIELVDGGDGGGRAGVVLGQQNWGEPELAQLGNRGCTGVIHGVAVDEHAPKVTVPRDQHSGAPRVLRRSQRGGHRGIGHQGPLFEQCRASHDHGVLNDRALVGGICEVVEIGAESLAPMSSRVRSAGEERRLARASKYRLARMNTVSAEATSR